MSKRSSDKHCPICDEPTQAPHAPFCSARCQQVDLNRWLSDSYFIPGSEVDDMDVDAGANATVKSDNQDKTRH